MATQLRTFGTNIALTTITSGHVLYNNGVYIAGEAFVSAVRGGTGISTAASNGTPHVEAGTWTVAAITGMVTGNGNSPMTGITGLAGAMAYWNTTTAIGSTAVGNAGQILQSGGILAPSFVNPSTVILNGTGLSWSLDNKTLNLTTPVAVTNGGTASSVALTGMIQGHGSSAMTAVTGTQYGVSYWSDANTIGSTAVGSSGYILKANGSAAPTWSQVSDVISGTAPISVSGSTISLTTPLTVTYGGTGATTLTGIVKGNASSAMTALTGTQYALSYWSDANTLGSTSAGTSGYILKANGSAVPTWAQVSDVISGTAPISVSGSTISLTTPVTVGYGGTGATTLTGVVKGNAASALTAMNGTAQYGVTYWSDLNTITGTAAGTNGYILRSNATSAPTWAQPSDIISGSAPISVSGSTISLATPVTVGYGGTGATTLTGVLKGNATSVITGITGTQYALTYWSDANTISSTAVGTNGYILRGNGSSVPTWTQVSDLISGTAPISVSGSTISLATPVTVGYGGTGATTLTGMLKGNAASAVTGVTGTQYAVSYWSDANTIGSTTVGTSGYLLKSNATSAPSWIEATNAATANTVAQRTTNGDISFGTVDVVELDITTGGILTQLGSTAAKSFTVSTTNGTVHLTGSLYTTTATATDILTITSRSGFVTVVDFTVVLSKTDGSATGVLKYTHRFLGNASSVTLAANPAVLLVDLDAALVGCTAALYWSGGSSTVVSARVAGLAATNIRWQAYATVTSRSITA